MPFDPALDPLAILGALGVHDPHALAPVSGGADTALWRVDHGGVRSALRVFRADQQSVYRREIAAMEVAWRAQLPVPAIRAAGLWSERPALLLSWCEGTPLRATLQRAPWRAWALGRAFGQMQARIHRVGAPALRQNQQADWIGWSGEGVPALQAALRRRAGDAEALLHLDYHPLNVLTDGAAITAVLDWANARAGDPRADVARTYTILLVMPYRPGREPLALRAFRRLLARAWQQGYRRVAGALEEMPLFYAWAGAAMVRDLAPRAASPESWLRETHLEGIRRWSRQWDGYVGQTEGGA